MTITETRAPWLKNLGDVPATLDYFQGSMYEAVEKIADEGFDPVYGARPLRRAIQSKIEDRIAEEMLEGKVKAEDHIEVTVEDGKFTCVSKTE